MNRKGAKLKLYKEDEAKYKKKGYWDDIEYVVHCHVKTLCDLLEIPPQLEESLAVTVEQVPHQAVMAVQNMRTGQLRHTAQYFGGKRANEHWGGEDVDDTVGGDSGLTGAVNDTRWKVDEARRELRSQT